MTIEARTLTLVPPGLVESITAAYELCTSCSGEGVVVVDCLPCKGTGHTGDGPCAPCEGDGGYFARCEACVGLGFQPRSAAGGAA